MAKKSNSQKEIQGLVIFKHKENLRKKKSDKFLVEKVNKADKITIINSIIPQGIHYRYLTLIKNENPSAIEDINIQILYPDFLKYTGSYPLALIVSSSIEDYRDKPNIIAINLKGLEGNSSERFCLHFTPSTQLGNSEFKTLLKYTNNEGKERQLNSKSINIQIVDMNIIPKIISHSRIREVSQIPGMKRGLISLGIGTDKKLKFNKIFSTFENLIASFNFQFITKDKEKGILWFFGSEIKSNDDILALSKIGSNFIEIIAYSINPIILSQFLFLLVKNLKEKLLMNKTVKSNVKIYEIECANCGESLPYFPKKGEHIRCIKCSYEQLIW